MTHLTFEEISELAESGAQSQHVTDCAECRTSLGRVQELLVATQALSRETAPPPEVWNTVRTRVAFLPPQRRRRPTRRPWWHDGRLAAAAALLLVLGTATFVGLMSRGRSGKAKAVMVAVPVVSPVLLAVDNSYVVTIRELRSTLNAQRSTLAPATVQTVERSLQVIDDAIAEARAALAADPANAALIDILSSHYERQVDLLQRAAALSSSL